MEKENHKSVISLSQRKSELLEAIKVTNVADRESTLWAEKCPWTDALSRNDFRKYRVRNKCSTNVAQRHSQEYKEHKGLKKKKFVVRRHRFRTGKAVKSAMQAAYLPVYFDLFPAFTVPSFPGYLGAVCNWKGPKEPQPQSSNSPGKFE